jgi:hypothetical protein
MHTGHSSSDVPSSRSRNSIRVAFVTVVSLMMTALFLTSHSRVAEWIPGAHASSPFTIGNLVVYRVGDGGAALGSAATAVFLDEYTPAGALVQSIALPTAVNGANKRLTGSGTATSEGALTRSVDGRYLILAGYDAALATTGITSSTASLVNRVIARVDATGAVDTTTALTDAISGGNPRGAASTNGTDLWISGTSSGGGIRYATFGSSTSTALNTTPVTNLRQVNVFGGQLYVSSGSGAFRVAAVGAGSPTTAGQIIANLPGYPTSTTSPYGFFFADLDPTVPGFDTLYVADDNASGGTGGIQKYSLVSGSWVANGSIASTGGLRGITGSVSGNTVTLYVAGNSTLSRVTDATGYNATISGSLTTLASALTNTAFRGVAFAPIGNAPTNPSGVGNTASAHPTESVLLTVAVTPGTNPTSTGLAVTADLSSIGGSSPQTLFDDGSHGDVTANDNVFSFSATVPLNTTSGIKSIPATITDAQSRTGSATVSLTVTPLSTPPTGTGSANPSSLQVGDSTLLTVAVTSGVNPPSSTLSVTGDLTSIGGSSSQQFYDDGTNGDATAHDNVFSFRTTIPVAITAGSKSLPISISDDLNRSSGTSISLTVQPPPASNSVKISQVYGGGGNSGSTYTNDFIELFNQGPNPVSLNGWSVQATSASGTSWTGNGQPTLLTGTILPGHYYLIQESQGSAGTTALPGADAAGALTLSAGNAKIALVASTATLSGTCPLGGAVVDFVGYGTANCFEGAVAPGLGNTTAAVRRGNGCIDADNNSTDFVSVGPIPRNSTSPVNSCGGDPGQISGYGIAAPSAADPASNVLLTVIVTGGIIPPSTGLAVVADLTNIGGAAGQQFYDDGTHGDKIAGDNTFSLQTPVGASISTGAKSVIATITDQQNRTATAPITLTVQSPTCGVERWLVKVGTDADAGLINLANPVRTTISQLTGLTAPPDPPGPPDNNRIQPTETTVFVLNATMNVYKKEDDVDYHIVLQDQAVPPHTLIAEIPSPACVLASTPTGRVLVNGVLSQGIANARTKFDARLTAQTFFQTANLPVQVKGVAFFDFIHGQTGVAPNGIELHPLLDIIFTSTTATTLTSSLSSSKYGQPVTITATVGSTGPSAATGNVSFFDSTKLIGTGALGANGTAAMTTSSLAVGSHSLTASYEGDSSSDQSTSAVFLQIVDKADQVLTFAPLSAKTYGDAPFTVTASGGGSENPVTFVASGNCTSGGTNGATITITGGGSCTVTASQAADENYNAAVDVERTFTINPASASISVAGYTGVYDGAPHGATGSATGVNGENLSGLLNLGALFTNVPGGSATWTFAGNSNYASATGSVQIVLTKAAPAFSSLTSPTITFGTASATLSGNLAAGGLIPTGNVTITVNGVTQTSAIQTGGTFSSVFNTSQIVPTNPPYAITYSYGGDNNFQSATGAGTLTVGYGVLALYDPAKAFRSGSVVPIRLQLTNNSGADVSASSIKVTAMSVVQVSTSASSDVQDAGNSSPDDNFRFDLTLGASGGYVFNLSSAGLTSGTYTLTFAIAGDPTSHAVSFEIK